MKHKVKFSIFQGRNQKLASIIMQKSNFLQGLGNRVLIVKVLIVIIFLTS